MQQIEVDLMHSKPGQTSVASRHRAVPVGVLRQHLAHQKDFVAPSLDGLADKPFGATVGVHFGRVDQAHAEIDAEAQRIDLVRPIQRILCHVPGPLAEHWNMFP
jgi:hypothetical protein